MTAEALATLLASSAATSQDEPAAVPRVVAPLSPATAAPTNAVSPSENESPPLVTSPAQFGVRGVVLLNAYSDVGVFSKSFSGNSRASFDSLAFAPGIDVFL